MKGFLSLNPENFFPRGGNFFRPWLGRFITWLGVWKKTPRGNWWSVAKTRGHTPTIWRDPTHSWRNTKTLSTKTPSKTTPIPWTKQGTCDTHKPSFLLYFFGFDIAHPYWISQKTHISEKSIRFCESKQQGPRPFADGHVQEGFQR